MSTPAVKSILSILSIKSISSFHPPPSTAGEQSPQLNRHNSHVKKPTTIFIPFLPYFLFFLSLTALTSTPRPAAAKEITVKDRLGQVGDTARNRLKIWFDRQRIDYPPDKVTMLVVKDQKRLKLFATDTKGDYRFIAQYAVAGLSGKLGPKLRAGDKQVPEGIYTVTYLNPMSRFWLSLGLNYPNAFDRARAKSDGRKNLGKDIMIHGSYHSEGCVAVGNTASEDLFVLAADVGIKNIKIVIAPVDVREDDPPAADTPKWSADLYNKIADEVEPLGIDGTTTASRLITYADTQPPRPAPKPGLLMTILHLLAEAAQETTTTETKK